MKQVVIYPAQVALITGKTEKSARTLLNQVRAAFGKFGHQFVTHTEFSHYSGISLEEIFYCLESKKQLDPVQLSKIFRVKQQPGQPAEE